MALYSSGRNLLLSAIQVSSPLSVRFIWLQTQKARRFFPIARVIEPKKNKKRANDLRSMKTQRLVKRGNFPAIFMLCLYFMYSQFFQFRFLTTFSRYF